jgi:hypothetical protein
LISECTSHISAESLSAIALTDGTGFQTASDIMIVLILY